MSALLTVDWYPFGKDRYFRKFEVYSMEWQNNPEIDLERVAITAAKNGGLVVVLRDRMKIVKVNMIGKPIFSIYTSSGKEIASDRWRYGEMVHIGWSTSEELLSVLDDGCVIIHNMFLQYQHTFKMGQEVQDTKVKEAQLFTSSMGTTGVAVLTGAYRFFLVNSYKDPKVRRLPEVQGCISPSAWVVVGGSRHTVVLLARGSELYSLNESETKPVPKSIDFGEDGDLIIAMAVSPSKTQLAMFTNRGKLWIGSVDLSRNSGRIYDTKDSSQPKQLVWCGDDTVCIHRNSAVEIFDGYDNWLNFNYDYPVHLVQESDCVRIITQFTHEILQKVPEIVKNILSINSTGPGAYLLEASKQYQKRSHKADEYIHLLKGKLNVAVDECIRAAKHQFTPDIQKMLIKAAQLGKCFLPDYKPNEYVVTARILRVLNSVRDTKIGIPITYDELEDIGVQQLLNMLLTRRHYYLALQIAKHLQLPNLSRVLMHWAYHKVQENSGATGEEIAKKIADKIGQRPDVSFSEIAKEAADLGKKELAIKLLNYEIRASLQVPLLLSLGQHQVALAKAIDSGNTDLVYTVLLHIRDSMPLGKFQMEIRNHDLAQSLYLKYCRMNNRDTLKDVLTQEDDFIGLAGCFIRDFYDPKCGGLREASLTAAQENFKRGKSDLNALFCEEQIKLRRYQTTLEEKFKRDFIDKSLHDTIELLLMMQEVKLADKLRTEYKVPDRRYWWLRIQCLGKLDEWAELEKFSKSKKPPFGYEPFIDICIKHHNKFEGHKYMPKVKDDLKVKYFVKLEMFKEAKHYALERRDNEAIKYIDRHLANNK